jgi:hypothetical protein
LQFGAIFTTGETHFPYSGNEETRDTEGTTLCLYSFTYQKGDLVKKFALLLAVCMLLLGLFPALVAATSVEDLTSLAAFYPADTVLFAAVRSDDAYLETLNAAISRIQRRVDAPVSTIQDAINDALDPAGLTFEEHIRPWLGDSIAVGVRNLDSRFGAQLMITLAVADPDMLMVWLETAGIEMEDAEEFVEFELEDAVLRLYDGALVVSQSADLLNEFAEGERLNDSEDFTATLALLPESDYNIVAYVQTSEIMEVLQAQMEANGDETADMINMLGGFGASGSQALGFTVLDGNNFVIDIAAHAAADAQPAADSAPLDLDFAARVPANTLLYIQDTNFGEDLRRTINLFALVVELGIDQQVASSVGEEVPPFIANMDRNDVRAFINLAFAGFTGLNLENDVLANLNGNIGMYIGVMPTADGIVPEAGVVAEMDGAASERIFNSLQDALTQYEADFSVDGNVLTLPLPTPDGLESAGEELMFDLTLGYNDEVFAIGTASAVNFSLDPGDASLASQAEFIAAQDTFLADAETLLYANIAPLARFIDDEVSPEASQYGNDALKILSLFESASISSLVDDDGASLARAVITMRSR